MMAVLERALETGTKAKKEEEVGQISFFNMGDSQEGFGKQDERLPDLVEWPQAQLLANEKTLLGFYLSGHPLDRYQAEINKFADFTTANIHSARDGQDMRMVGLINAVKLTTTRKTNERMAIVGIEDIHGEMELVVFPSNYTQMASYLKESTVVVVKGKVSFKDGFPKMIANEMTGIDEVYGLIKSVHVNLSQVGQAGFEKLKEKLARFPGQVPVYLQLESNSYKSVQILVGQDLFVTPSEVLMEEVKALVGEGNFSLTL